MIRSLAVPGGGDFVVLGDAETLFEQPADPVIRIRVALFGGHFVIAHRLAVVLLHTDALGVHQTQLEFGLAIAFCRRCLEKLHGRFGILLHAQTAHVHNAEIRFGVGIALRGHLFPDLKRRCVVLGLERGHARILGNGWLDAG